MFSLYIRATVNTAQNYRCHICNLLPVNNNIKFLSAANCTAQHYIDRYRILLVQPGLPVFVRFFMEYTFQFIKKAKLSEVKSLSWAVRYVHVHVYSVRTFVQCTAKYCPVRLPAYDSMYFTYGISWQLVVRFSR
jgi:hypothetical protein